MSLSTFKLYTNILRMLDLYRCYLCEVSNFESEMTFEEGETICPLSLT